MSSVPCFLLKVSYSHAVPNLDFFFFFFPCWPHEDAVTFRFRKCSLFYSCQLGRVHMETRKLRQLLPQSVCPWPEVVAPSGLLESAPLPDGLWFMLQHADVCWNWHLFLLIPRAGSWKFRTYIFMSPSAVLAAGAAVWKGRGCAGIARC